MDMNKTDLTTAFEQTSFLYGGNADYIMLTDKDTAGARERHWNDLWHYPLFQMVRAARA